MNANEPNNIHENEVTENNQAEEEFAEASPVPETRQATQAEVPTGILNESDAMALFHQRLRRLSDTTAKAKVGNGVCILSDDRDGEPYQQMNRTAFLAKYENLVVEYRDADDKIRELNPARTWLRDAAQTQYKRIDYYPEGEPEGVYNLFQGWGVKASEEGSCDLFLEHVLTNICDGNVEYYDFLMDWVADIFKNPGLKHNTAVVLQGVQGCGKTIFAKAIGHLAGERNFFTVSHTGQLAGRFNSHLAAKALIFADEALPPKSLEDNGRVKSLISDNEMTLEPKGRDAYRVRNLARVIFASNADLVVPAENNERRYFVLKVSPEQATNIEYFGNLQEQLDDGGYGALMRTLLQRDFEHDSLRVCPKTPHLQEQMRLQQDPTQAWFLERLEDGEIQGDQRLDDILKRYQKDMKESGSRSRDRSWLCRVMKKLFPHAKNFQAYARVDGERKRINTYPFGSKEDCVLSFQLATGIEVNLGVGETGEAGEEAVA